MKNDQIGHYANVLKNWHVNVMGSKPTSQMLETAHNLGCRAGKQALARAMELRPEGATDGQVKAACIAGWGASGSHHNKRRDLIGAQLLKAVPTPDNAAGHKVYRCELTAKGKAKITAVSKPVVEKVKKTKPVKPEVVAPVAQPVA